MKRQKENNKMFVNISSVYIILYQIRWVFGDNW